MMPSRELSRRRPGEISKSVLALVLLVPVAPRLSHFGRLHMYDLLLSLAAGLTCVLRFEALKLYRRCAHRRVA
jgi:hypothetical protein